MEATVITSYELSGARIYIWTSWVWILRLLVQRVSASCMHFFSFFTLVWSQVVRMENRNWGIRCLVQVFICLFYSRSLLVFCFKCSSVSMSIPNSLTIPSPILPLVTIRLLQSIEQSSLCCPAISISKPSWSIYISWRH